MRKCHWKFCRVKNLLSSNNGLLYAKELALQHGFNTAINKLIWVCGIFFETYQILMDWFGLFFTLLNYQLLRWHRVVNPVLFHAINFFLKKSFFLDPKGGQNSQEIFSKNTFYLWFLMNSLLLYLSLYLLLNHILIFQYIGSLSVSVDVLTGMSSSIHDNL